MITVSRPNWNLRPIREYVKQASSIDLSSENEGFDELMEVLKRLVQHDTFDLSTHLHYSFVFPAHMDHAHFLRAATDLKYIVHTSENYPDACAVVVSGTVADYIKTFTLVMRDDGLVPEPVIEILNNMFKALEAEGLRAYLSRFKKKYKNDVFYL